MSLAMYAAPFNDNSNNQYLNEENNTQSANKKRQPHNKTQRKPVKEFFDVNKVNSVLEEIHSNSNEDDSNNLGDFNPPPPPDSSGVNKTIASEQSLNLSNTQNKEMFKLLARTPQPNDDNTNINYSLNSYNNYGDEKSVDEYYKKNLPGYERRLPVNKPYYNMNYSNYNNDSNNFNKMDNTNDILLQKLNYMINLLEEKQDEKTNNVMEEVILYSFLGIFIIFVIDSFARVGKYVR